jgi:predicted SnoaL-like aldol condensation-catalyzing enzyme
MKRKTSRDANKTATNMKNSSKAKTTRMARTTRVAKNSRKPVRLERAKLRRNKEMVLAFYDLLINKKDFNAAARYMGADYIQHNPTAATGVDGLRVWMTDFYRRLPDLRANVRRVIAEGDLVALHVEGTNGPGLGGSALVDIFRVRDGKIVEHWDVIQPIPKEALNNNSMF